MMCIFITELLTFPHDFRNGIIMSAIAFNLFDTGSKNGWMRRSLLNRLDRQDITVSEAEAMLDFWILLSDITLKGYHLVSSGDCVVIDRKGSCVNQ